MKYLKIIVYLITLGKYCGDIFTARKLAKRFSCFLFHYINFQKTRCADIPLSCVLPESTLFPHDIYGCFFSVKAVIGENCTIFHHVTIGSNFENKNKESEMGKTWGAPTIKDHVFIGAGAKIIGPINVGSGAKIGAGCVVVKNVPSQATCVMQNSRIIKKQNKIK